MHNYVLLILIKVSFEFVAEEIDSWAPLQTRYIVNFVHRWLSACSNFLQNIYNDFFRRKKKCFGMNSRNAAAWTLTTLHECVKKNYECSSWCRSYITFQYFCHGYVKKYDGKQILSTLYLYITKSWFIFFVYYLF